MAESTVRKDKRDKTVVLIEFKAFEGWRAELWVRPYRGYMLAATRWTSKTWARRDAVRVFGRKAEP